MAIVLMESWDGFGGDTTAAGKKWTGSPATSASHARSGYAFYGGTGNVAGRAIAPRSTTLYFGARVYFTSGSAPAQGGVLVGFVSSATFTGFNAVCALNLDAAGTVRVTNGFNAGTTLGTSVATLTSAATNTIRAKFVLGASGSYEVYLGGTLILSGSGNMGGTTVGGVHLGGQTSGNYALDDLWILDSTGTTNNSMPTEELYVSCHLPTGDGARAEWTPSTGTAHAALVDEAIANDDTDYVSGTAGQRDTYTVDLSTIAGHVRYGAQVSADVKATSAGANYVYGLARESGGTETLGPPLTVPTAYAYIEQGFD